MLRGMLWVYRSNRVEKLTASLAQLLSHPIGGPMELDWVGVSGIGMRNYIERQIALRLGISAGIQFPFPKEILDVICLQTSTDNSLFEEGVLTWSIYALLPEISEQDPLSPIKRFLAENASDTKRLGLARKVAHTFCEYALFRPQMVLAWEKNGAPGDWQAILWRALVKRLGAVHIARFAADFLSKPEERLRKLPFRRLSLFCVPTFSPLYVSVLSAAARYLDVHLFMLSPSAEWWADLGSPDESAVHHHPLLTTLGRTGSDFQWLLEENGSYLEPVGDLHEAPTDGGVSMLRLLQSDMLNLRSPTRDFHVFQKDRSIQIHACPGPLRELEVVKEQLLECFNGELPGLSPDDIAVLAPDIQTFAPFIHAVFGADRHPLPFNIVGDFNSGSPVLPAFCYLLNLPSKRLTVRDVFDFLAADPVRRKFGLSAGEVVELERVLVEAGVRWGEDGRHRETVAQPPFEENTWRFGLDRLLLSLAFGSETSYLFAGKSPCRAFSRDDKVLFAALIQFLETLFEVTAAMRNPMTPPQWVVLLQSALSRLFIRDAKTDTALTAVYRTLVAWQVESEKGGFHDSLSLAAVRKFLTARIEDSTGRKEWRPFGITFADIRTFRGVPFRVICLVGLNEAVYPKLFRAPDFDKMAEHPQRGDRSSLDDDRFQFLEAVLSARDSLILTYTGNNPQDGAVQFPSSPVTELLNCIHRNFGMDEQTVILKHPISPFNPDYFGRTPDSRMFSRDESALRGARAIEGHVSLEKAFFNAPIGNEVAEPQLAVSSLIRFFSEPHRLLLAERLGIRFPWITHLPSAREPMTDSGDNRQLERFLLTQRREGVELADLEETARALGILPLGDAGRVRFRRIRERVQSFFEKVDNLGLGGRLGDRPLDLKVAGTFGQVRLVGTVEGIREKCLTGVVFSKFDAISELIALHVYQSAAALSGSADRAVLIGFDSSADQITPLAAPSDPEVFLSDLTALYFAGMTQPLPYFPGISHRFAEDRYRGKPLEAALKIARAGWRAMNPIRDAAALNAFRGRDPFDASHPPSLSFEAISMRVFTSIIESAAKGGA